jgi:hypothetical protein
MGCRFGRSYYRIYYMIYKLLSKIEDNRARGEANVEFSFSMFEIKSVARSGETSLESGRTFKRVRNTLKKETKAELKFKISKVNLPTHISFLWSF